MAEYVRTYTQPGAMQAGFSYYRAIPQDIMVNKEIIKKFKLPMPVLAIGGAVSYPDGRGRANEPEKSLRRVALNVQGEVFADCGHFVPEESPELLMQSLRLFFEANS